MLAEVVTYKKTQITEIVNAPDNAQVIAISYAYDVMGRRVAKVVDGVTTKYVYDGWNMIAELDGSDNVIAWYVYAGMDRPLARVSADGTVHYYHQDILGSVIALTDSTGAMVTQYNYSPFGETQVSHLIGNVDQPFQFTAKFHDPETGLLYFPYRYYSWEMRRFISEDPLRFAAGDVNFYAYVGNNPINFNDPLGLEYDEFSQHDDPTTYFVPGECGSTNFNKIAVPDKLGKTNIRPACLVHDACYADCNKTKDQCDAELYQNVLKACGSSGRCRLLAEIFFLGVSSGAADDAYKKAQEENGCCEKK